MSDSESILKTAAKKIGAAAGTVASAVGIHGESHPAQSPGKLPKKNKAKLPRREKKAQKRAHMHATAQAK